MVASTQQPQRSMPTPSAETPSRPLSKAGPYEPVILLGRGGMASVYLCRRMGSLGFERLYALKVIHEHLAHDDKFVRMFMDEVRVLAAIRHPNVTNIVDAGVVQGRPYLVMDWIEGTTLSRLLARHRRVRPPGLVVRIMVEVLRGLHAAHTTLDCDGHPMEIVHRDVSPHNILVGVDGIARIADFGVAMSHERLTETAPGIAKGRPHFMAPEQLCDDAPIDARTDVFAAGAVLWTALTGEPVFSGSGDHVTMMQVMRARIPRPSLVGLRPPGWLDTICLKALSRDPAARFQSAGEMAEALRDVASREGSVASPVELRTWVRETFSTELSHQRELAAGARHGSSPSPAQHDPQAAVSASPEAPVPRPRPLHAWHIAAVFAAAAASGVCLALALST